MNQNFTSIYYTMISWLGYRSTSKRKKATIEIDNELVVSFSIIVVRILYGQLIMLCDDEQLF